MTPDGEVSVDGSDDRDNTLWTVTVAGADCDGRTLPQLIGEPEPAPAGSMSVGKAIALAARLHAEQVDKQGKPYILHPLAVMALLGCDSSQNLQIAAILHDVIEDTDTTLDDLRHAGVDEPTVGMIDLLTRRPGERYEAFVKRIGTSPEATTVKLADLAHNMDPDRIPPGERGTGKYESRMRRYRRAKEYLVERLIVHSRMHLVAPDST